MLMSQYRELIKSIEGIEAEILEFYKKLLRFATTNLHVIHTGVLKQGSLLNKTQQLQLINPFTKEEVVQALKGIDDMKAPRGDGFNAYFFKKALAIAGGGNKCNP